MYVSMNICIYVHVFTCVYVYIFVYMDCLGPGAEISIRTCVSRTTIHIRVESPKMHVGSKFTQTVYSESQGLPCFGRVHAHRHKETYPRTRVVSLGTLCTSTVSSGYCRGPSKGFCSVIILMLCLSKHRSGCDRSHRHQNLAIFKSANLYLAIPLLSPGIAATNETIFALLNYWTLSNCKKFPNHLHGASSDVCSQHIKDPSKQSYILRTQIVLSNVSTTYLRIPMKFRVPKSTLNALNCELQP